MSAKHAKRKALRARNKTRRGRPRESEPWSRVTVVLYDRQIVRLDRLATSIGRQTGKVMNRAALIRGLIDALFDSGINVTGAGSERELRVCLAKHLSQRIGVV